MLMATLVSYAKVDLVTLPNRESTQLTIYNSANLTLVRDNRNLTVKNGKNELQFSWANTLIDPTSIDLLPKANGQSIDVFDLTYPANTRNLGYWTINSQINGENPFEISYLTSGLTWNAFYLATLSADETSMNLDAYVKVTNNSGEDYDNAQVRLIVGQVNIIDSIAALARRQYPYQSPMTQLHPILNDVEMVDMVKSPQKAKGMRMAFASAESNMVRKKEVKKEGLSEYFLYTIEGTESIPNTWAKRLPSFDVQNVKVDNLYKYNESRYGKLVRRFLYFKNDEEHKLGETPIPGGEIQVFGTSNDSQLTYTGRSSFKYIPVEQEVELPLGSVEDVTVEITKMKETTHNYMFDPKKSGRIVGWDLTENWQVEIKNMRNIPIKLEITRDLYTQYWNIVNHGEFGNYIKDDLDTVKYKIDLPANNEVKFEYILTKYNGRRATIKK
jgi:hypothetical protein